MLLKASSQFIPVCQERKEDRRCVRRR